ncbi:response regulator [Paenibacillus sp. HN-1]|uniref:response regulator n=1 Tax=Paenibacillus TaxID=44249 RepID=UPI001CA9E3B9|nr:MULTISPECIES: response regulator [Paenibacillus]MBY9077010.1 response regulator [Paenibacillus sp. CGMCC 1.18879]MBY9086617.1 response regulator [Paenibacillus sinensis]
MEDHAQKVLYVEDNLLNMALMHHLFKKNLPSVLLLKAETGEQGLEIAQEQLPDLIILDIGLPGMNGYEIMECLQRSAGTSCIPVLAVSAFALMSDLDMARDTGFAGYITKPIQVRVFTETVQELLAGAGRLTRN